MIKQNVWPKIIVGVILLCSVLCMFIPMNAVSAVSRNVGSDNLTGVSGGLGDYSGLPSALGGSWGDTKKALLGGDIAFIDPTILVMGGEFYGRWFPKGGDGFESLNPAAKEAAKIVGYGEIPYKPMLYLTQESKDTAIRLGFGDENIPVLYPW